MNKLWYIIAISSLSATTIASVASFGVYYQKYQDLQNNQSISTGCYATKQTIRLNNNVMKINGPSIDCPSNSALNETLILHNNNCDVNYNGVCVTSGPVGKICYNADPQTVQTIDNGTITIYGTQTTCLGTDDYITQIYNVLQISIDDINLQKNIVEQTTFCDATMTQDIDTGAWNINITDIQAQTCLSP